MKIERAELRRVAIAAVAVLGALSQQFPAKKSPHALGSRDSRTLWPTRFGTPASAEPRGIPTYAPAPWEKAERRHSWGSISRPQLLLVNKKSARPVRLGEAFPALRQL